MINFVNTGADEAILKAMSTEGCSEELIKAMNKQGLVQKDVTVQGKNGKTFTRKQWVKASDVQSSVANVSQNSVSQGITQWKKPNKIGGTFGAIAYGTNSRTPQSLSNFTFGFSERMRQTKFPHIKNTGSQDSIKALKEIIAGASWSAQGVCDAINKSGIGETNWKVVSDTKDVIKIQCKDYNGNSYTMVITPRQTANKSDSQISQDEKRLRGYKIGESIYVKYNGEWKKATKKQSFGNPYWDGLPADLNDRGIAKLEWSDKLPTSTSKPSTSKPSLDTAHFDSIKSDKAKALEYLKDCGVTWSENSHAGINWMRAMAAYKAATGGQKSTQKTQSSTPTTSQPTTQTAQVAQNPQGNSGIKMSKEDAKKKTQSFTSKVGKTDAERKAFMDKVKAQGITWKDKADDGSDVAIGVSWMRCCMAMNKHFAEGGSFDDSSSKSGKLGTKQDRENFLTGLIRSSVEDEITKTLKSIADGFDPNIDSGSWIQPDHVLNINLDSAVMQSQQYDLGVKSGNAFKKLISDKLKEMGFEVNKMGKRKSADGVSFWFDLSSGN